VATAGLTLYCPHRALRGNRWETSEEEKKNNSVKVDQEGENGPGGRKEDKRACFGLLLELSVCCPSQACVDT